MATKKSKKKTRGGRAATKKTKRGAKGSKKKAAKKKGGKKKTKKKAAKKAATRPASKASKKRATKKKTAKRSVKKKATKRVSGKAAKKKTAKRSAKKKATKRVSGKAARKKTAKRSAKKILTRAAKKARKIAKKARKIAKKTLRQAAPPAAPAEEAPAGVGAGDRAPEFSLPDQDDNTVSSSDLEGQPYVLYFYPKDDTPGCTKEACGFRDDFEAFRDVGVRVIGVSPDKPASHRKFRDKYDLNFTLLSDEDRELARAFGVWVKKKNYGREYMGIDRSTFVIDSAGVVKKAWRGVKVDGHVGAVLEAVKDL